MKKPLTFREFEPELWTLCDSNVQPLSHPGPPQHTCLIESSARDRSFPSDLLFNLAKTQGSGMAQWLYFAVTQGPERRFEFSEG